MIFISSRYFIQLLFIGMCLFTLPTQVFEIKTLLRGTYKLTFVFYLHVKLICRARRNSNDAEIIYKLSATDIYIPVCIYIYNMLLVCYLSLN